MTDTEVRTLLREHVSRTEPPLGLDLDTVRAGGRRRRRRRRLAAGVTGLAAAGALGGLVALTGPSGLGSGAPSGVDPATSRALEHYDAAAMPRLLDDHVRSVLDARVPDLGAPRFTATDGNGDVMPQRYWDKASSMSIGYRAGSGARYDVSLGHARSEAEGNARRICAADVAEGTDLSCEVRTGADGSVIQVVVRALLPLDEPGAGGWAVVPRDALASGRLPDWMEDRRLDPSKLYFERSVKAVHSKTFVSNVAERVHAATQADADERWRAPVEDLIGIATDPELVIPRPPTGDGGCPWTLPGTRVGCTG